MGAFGGTSCCTCHAIWFRLYYIMSVTGNSFLSFPTSRIHHVGSSAKSWLGIRMFGSHSTWKHIDRWIMPHYIIAPPHLWVWGSVIAIIAIIGGSGILRLFITAARDHNESDSITMGCALTTTIIATRHDGCNHRLIKANAAKRTLKFEPWWFQIWMQRLTDSQSWKILW